MFETVHRRESVSCVSSVLMRADGKIRGVAPDCLARTREERIGGTGTSNDKERSIRSAIAVVDIGNLRSAAFREALRESATTPIT